MQVLTDLFAGPWGPALIFLFRVADVGMGTLRMMLTMQGRKWTCWAIGILEVTIWFLAAASALQNMNSPLHVAGYALGFGTGALVGMWIEEKLAFGHCQIQIVAPNGGVEISEALRDRGFGVTEFLGVGGRGRVEVAMSVIRRKRLPEALKIIDEWGPEAFVTVQSPRAIRKGFMGQMKRI